MGDRESVLYYAPERSGKARKVKGILVRLGIRIRNIAPEQIQEQVGTLAGLEEFAGKRDGKVNEAVEQEAHAERGEMVEREAHAESGEMVEQEAHTERGEMVEQEARAGSIEAVAIPEEMLVLCNFTQVRLDRLLRELRKSNASVSLKAVLTETNCAWTFYELYCEIRREHLYMMEKMKKQQETHL